MGQVVGGLTRSGVFGCGRKDCSGLIEAVRDDFLGWN